MILKAIKSALGDLLSPKIILIFILPPFVFSIFWISLVTWNWQWITTMVEGFFKHAEWFKLVLKVMPFLLNDSFFNIVTVTSFIILLAGLFPLTFLGSLLVYSLVANPVVFSVVLKKNYPQLTRVEPPFIQGLFHSLWIAFLFLILWVLSLPLWLVPGGAIAVPLFLSAFVNKKIYAHDTLAELVSDSDRKQVEEELSSQYWQAAFVCAGINFLPFAIFFSPIIAALIFMHISATKITQNDFKVG